ncbi:MAG: hypothetical protein RIS76_348 [Verrucomicrobiota bacterium]
MSISVEELLAEMEPELCPLMVGTPTRYSPTIDPRCIRLPEYDLANRDLLPPLGSTWDAEKRQQNAVIAQLPRRLQRLVRRVRQTHFRQTLLDIINVEVRCLAAADGRVFQFQETAYEPSVDLRKYWSTIADNSVITRRLYDEAKTKTAQAAYDQTWFAARAPQEFSPVKELPFDGRMEAASWAGLTTRTLPHRPPEGLLLAIAKWFWRRHGNAPEKSLLVLDWGAGNSPFSRALVVTNPSVVPADVSDMTFEVETAKKVHGERRWIAETETTDGIWVDEVEMMGEPSEVPIVRHRYAASASSDRYDLLLVQLPPPCVARGGHRDWHKDRGSSEVARVLLPDLGRLGPRRWKASVTRILPTLCSAMADAGDIVVLVPLFCVGTTEPLEATESVVAAVTGAGLTTSRMVKVTQPSSAECWMCLVASQSGVEARHDAYLDEDPTSLLRELEA